MPDLLRLGLQDPQLQFFQDETASLVAEQIL